ncbi:hypothetical protein GJAV_G00259890 [Gymnothorax javanicus]|nr:hypothetical protein GJAV_G00259890 [Gymnothorax javanicus]
MATKRFKVTVLFMITNLQFGDCTADLIIRSNGNLTLQPNVQGPIEDILWRWNNHKVVEFDQKNFQDYGQFKGRTILNVTTGALTLTRITESDSGEYVGELQIGGKLMFHTERVKVLDPVGKASVSCSVSGATVTLLCLEDGRPATQSRWEGPGIESQMGSQLQLDAAQGSDSVYTCVLSNSVSQSRAAFPLQSCYPPQESFPVIPVIITLLVIIIIIIILIIAGLLYMKYHRTRDRNRKQPYEALSSDQRQDHHQMERQIQCPRWPESAEDIGLLLEDTHAGHVPELVQKFEARSPGRNPKDCQMAVLNQHHKQTERDKSVGVSQEESHAESVDHRGDSAGKEMKAVRETSLTDQEEEEPKPAQDLDPTEQVMEKDITTHDRHTTDQEKQETNPVLDLHTASTLQGHVPELVQKFEARSPGRNPNDCQMAVLNQHHKQTERDKSVGVSQEESHAESVDHRGDSAGKEMKAVRETSLTDQEEEEPKPAQDLDPTEQVMEKDITTHDRQTTEQEKQETNPVQDLRTSSTLQGHVPELVQKFEARSPGRNPNDCQMAVLNQHHKQTERDESVGVSQEESHAESVDHRGDSAGKEMKAVRETSLTDQEEEEPKPAQDLDPTEQVMEKDIRTHGRHTTEQEKQETNPVQDLHTASTLQGHVPELVQKFEARSPGRNPNDCQMAVLNQHHKQTERDKSVGVSQEESHAEEILLGKEMKAKGETSLTDQEEEEPKPAQDLDPTEQVMEKDITTHDRQTTEQEKQETNPVQDLRTSSTLQGHVPELVQKFEARSPGRNPNDCQMAVLNQHHKQTERDESVGVSQEESHAESVDHRGDSAGKEMKAVRETSLTDQEEEEPKPAQDLDPTEQVMEKDIRTHGRHTTEQEKQETNPVQDLHTASTLQGHVPELVQKFEAQSPGRNPNDCQMAVLNQHHKQTERDESVGVSQEESHAESVDHRGDSAGKEMEAVRETSLTDQEEEEPKPAQDLDSTEQVMEKDITTHDRHTTEQEKQETNPVQDLHTSSPLQEHVPELVHKLEAQSPGRNPNDCQMAALNQHHKQTERDESVGFSQEDSHAESVDHRGDSAGKEMKAVRETSLTDQEEEEPKPAQDLDPTEQVMEKDITTHDRHTTEQEKQETNPVQDLHTSSKLLESVDHRGDSAGKEMKAVQETSLTDQEEEEPKPAQDLHTPEQEEKRLSEPALKQSDTEKTVQIAEQTV